jgi:hypothetical protein
MDQSVILPLVHPERYSDSGLLLSPMKKPFLIFGSIFLALIILGAIGIAFLVVKGIKLDNESRRYADAVTPAIVSAWSEKALLDRASPEFKKAVTIDELDRMFRWFSGLGSLQRCEPAEGHALMSATTLEGKKITAQYFVKTTFEKGEATIKLTLIRHGEQWQISAFSVHSAALAPP